MGGTLAGIVFVVAGVAGGVIRLLFPSALRLDHALELFENQPKNDEISNVTVPLYRCAIVGGAVCQGVLGEGARCVRGGGLGEARQERREGRAQDRGDQQVLYCTV